MRCVLKILVALMTFLALASCGIGVRAPDSGTASVGTVISNGDGTKTVTVNGSGFTAGVTVTINGYNCANVQIISSTELTCLIAETVAILNVIVNYPASGGGGGTGSSGITEHTIFVTSTTYSGSLGGLSGGDAKCAARAVLGSKTSTITNVTWRAILSIPGTNVKDRLDLTTGYALKNTRGETVVANVSSLWGGSLTNAVNYDESGNGAPSVRAWTGTTWGGILKGDHCVNWTDGTVGEAGDVGQPQSNATGWMEAGADRNCDETHPIYCINSKN